MNNAQIEHNFFYLSVPNEAPANVRKTSVSDTSIDIAWDDPSLPSEIWDIFQGYEVYIRQAGSAQVKVTIINEHVNSVTLPGLEPWVTYNISVAAYNLAGAGKESEIIVVTTTFGKSILKETSTVGRNRR